MSTHRDVVQQAALDIGLMRSGESMDGTNYGELLAQFERYLRVWDEDLGLDFDPLDANNVPAKRVPYLAEYFMYHPCFDRFDSKNGRIQRRTELRLARLRLAAALEHETDYESPGPENF